MNYLLSLVTVFAAPLAFANPCDRSLGPERDPLVEALGVANDLTRADEALWVMPLVEPPTGPVMIFVIGPGSSRKSNLAKRIAGLVPHAMVRRVAMNTRDELRQGLREVEMTAFIDQPPVIVIDATLPTKYKTEWTDATHARAELERLGFKAHELERLAGAYHVRD